MNQSKFSLADVLSVLAAIAFGFVCFLGANFLHIDNDKVWGMSHTTGCVVMAVSISALFFGTSYGAKLLKRTSHNFKTCFIWEMVLLTIFVLLGIFFISKSSPFTHYFTVTAQKSAIKSKLITSITQVEKMFDKYESDALKRENIYKHTLQSAANGKVPDPDNYDKYFDKNTGVSDSEQIATKTFTLHTILFPSNYSDTISGKGIKEVATKWLGDAKNKTSPWKPIGIVSVVTEIEKNSNEWRKTLISFSEVPKQGKPADAFRYPLFPKNVKMHFNKVDSPRPISLGLSILAYGLMLFSYIVTKRSSKREDAFATRKYEVVL